jgi:MFS family permease
MADTALSSPRAAGSSLSKLLPLMAAVFVGFLVVGLALPVLPLHVHQGLGMSPFVVGLVTGSQFVASVATRMWAGNFADTKGAKRAVVAGMLAATVAGLLYLGSLFFDASPSASVTILLLGRALLGAGESFIITGALGWGVALVGPQSTGKVMAWMGTAMFGAFAAGAPLGTALYAQSGFMAIALATIVVPFATFLLVARMRPVAPTAVRRPSFIKVLGLVWVPGLALALSSLGFGAIMAFVALLFEERGWTPSWAAFTAFAVAFMLARLLLGHVVDKWGGARIALVSIVIEAAGQFLLWNASGVVMGIAGAALTGLGYSLIYPGLGVEAARRAPPESRALALGAYTACLDVALGVGTPALGFMAGHTGMSSIFLVSAVLILCAIPITVHLMRASPRQL